jgi:hypothetical protein
VYVLGLPVEAMTNPRIVDYVRHEFHRDPEPCTGTLLTFVYDIPYLGACGVFPPLHIINQVFSSGGETGGMSPGATWQPFTISKEEYKALVSALKMTPLSEIKPHARYTDVTMKCAPDFDHIQDRIAWIRAVCSKHRDSWHEELSKARAGP